MTLRIKETALAEELKKQQSKDEFPLDLTEDGPIYGVLHPKLILARFQFEESPESPVRPDIPGWHYLAFESLEAARKAFPEISLQFTGRPWTMFEFLSRGQTEAIIDFPGIGTAVLSQNELPEFHSTGVHQHLIPVWLSYALSPELWGPQGKWTRFHQKLLQIFEARGLLETGSPGRYLLKGSASLLAKYGFQGTQLDKSYLLVLPWTFSLSALNKLEMIIQQEF